ncbi:2-hydroxyacid dehydrogenase [Hyphomonas sp.]|uniref:2-hydroxyacid dehydrogenase n=1 Tax=Hyphomonas sp. TaxID=87 RepID=UPI003F715834
MPSSRPVVICVLPTVWEAYFVNTFRTTLGAFEFVTPSDHPDVQRVQYALVLQPPAGYLREFCHLKAIMPIGAGVEHVLSDPELPDVPLVRMVQPDMAQRMSEYIAQHSLNHLRRLREIQAAQRARRWIMVHGPPATDCTIGILGYGALGQHACDVLRGIGFKVRGWSRTPKAAGNAEMFHGKSALPDFLSKCQVLVNLLPLTPQTRGMIDSSIFEALPPGVSFINASRGAIVNDSALLSHLDSGHISEATLDAFAIEPLAPTHSFWTHPSITVTPHCASAATASAVSARLKQVIETIEQGGTPDHVVDRALGY